ncbi:MAG: hypothetical protein B6D41_01025 [Chloroflexi bacterium UTCFX4]|jgi:hypothetical protein|nr:MAG: hypothetical protein B6D41_01025 [Chloroflexi bacterium UTCFX4]
MENETITTTDSRDEQSKPVQVATENSPTQQSPTKAKVMFEQTVLFELEPDEARDTEYLRKLLEPHYSAATDAKFDYRQEGDVLIVTMLKQNPPKG